MIVPLAYNGTNKHEMRMDEASRALLTIDYAHHEIHGGSFFSAFYDADKSIGETMDILIVTPNTTKWAHLVFEVENESECAMGLYEAVTASNNGTGLTEFNRDRNSATAATVAVFHTPTVSDTGTQIYGWHSGSGRGNGSNDRAKNEFILKQNTKYLLRCTATAAGWIAARLSWYEHINAAA